MLNGVRREGHNAGPGYGMKGHRQEHGVAATQLLTPIVALISARMPPRTTLQWMDGSASRM
jgi:hypothetical protein